MSTSALEATLAKKQPNIDDSKDEAGEAKTNINIDECN